MRVMTAAVSGVAIGVFAALSYFVLHLDQTLDFSPMSISIIETWKNVFLWAMGYYIGSSVGSAKRTDADVAARMNASDEEAK